MGVLPVRRFLGRFLCGFLRAFLNGRFLSSFGAFLAWSSFFPSLWQQATRHMLNSSCLALPYPVTLRFYSSLEPAHHMHHACFPACSYHNQAGTEDLMRYLTFVDQDIPRTLLRLLRPDVPRMTAHEVRVCKPCKLPS